MQMILCGFTDYACWRREFLSSRMIAGADWLNARLVDYRDGEAYENEIWVKVE